MDEKLGFPTKDDGHGHTLIGVPSSVPGKTNWLRYYEVPAEEDYTSLLRLLDSFQMRFVSHVSRGETIRPTKQFFTNAHDLLEKAESQAKSGDGSSLTTADLLRRNTMPRIVKSDLVVAYEKKGIEAIRNYIVLRAKQPKGAPETEEMKAFATEAQTCLTNIVKYAGPKGINLRRENGETDRDGALHEMLTEGFNILLGAKPEGRNYFANIFLKNRYIKMSRAWDDIDQAGAAIKKLVEKDPDLSEAVIENGKLIDVIELLSEAAKNRAHLRRGDPDYYIDTDPYLRSIRGDLVDMTPDHKHQAQPEIPTGLAHYAPRRPIRGDLVDMTPDHKHQAQPEIPTGLAHYAPRRTKENEPNEEAYRLMRDGVELIYDMSKIRLGRPVSVKVYVSNVDRHLKREKERSAASMSF